MQRNPHVPQANPTLESLRAQGNTWQRRTVLECPCSLTGSRVVSANA